MDDFAKRTALAARINRLAYPDDVSRVGWFKVAPLSEVTQYADRIQDDEIRGADPYGDRRLLQLFLCDWLCMHLPEHIGSPTEDLFQPIVRNEALRIVNEIVSASEQRVSGITGCLEGLRSRFPQDNVVVRYPMLREWFAELFGGSCRFYLYGVPGTIAPPHEAPPHVIAIAPDVIGMLWLE